MEWMVRIGRVYVCLGVITMTNEIEVLLSKIKAQVCEKKLKYQQTIWNDVKKYVKDYNKLS